MSYVNSRTVRGIFLRGT